MPHTAAIDEEGRYAECRLRGKDGQWRGAHGSRFYRIVERGLYRAMGCGRTMTAIISPSFTGRKS